ncbi:SdiA-regulated domain-containing protein [Aestuariirhabdus sp. Z084]|uniref:SdiA-regulated domain-containing protein n=1 Tax=Aestuariirhabdus haliotis TaxID=2918751 RepID=UPI00201B3BE7|nr:SdiA-regulated domain-containing protein [Aestuariirhabdus haliotis]MCL6415294.1 SdiA-regulated domain-containing protein [Aestuariirhabdus haliotis]MCL6419554.1 SdiA-regulated domain-containing protein [Aestuariirhabdus haliotis]
MRKVTRRFLLFGGFCLCGLAIVSLLDWDDQLLNRFVKWRHSDHHSTLQGRWQLHSAVKSLPATGGELSGLTWSEKTQTLFAVRNKPAAILELDRDGRLLRTINVAGVSDPEAIVWLDGDRFAIADERNQTLYAFSIDPGVTALDVSKAHHLSLGIELNGNKGFEGLAYDRNKQRLYVAKEREPQRLYVLGGYTGTTRDQLNIQRLDDWQGRSNFFMSDFSGLQFVAQTGHLLVLSDESSLLVELSGFGELIAFMELDSGFLGLSEAVPQAEGVTLGPEGDLFIVSEPDLFYRFTKTDQVQTGDDG